MTKYIRRNHSVHNLGYHLIISTKYRQSYLLPFESDLKNYFSIVADKIDISIKDINIMPDHVHAVICISNQSETRYLTEKTFSVKAKSLSFVVRNYKSTVTMLTRKIYIMHKYGEDTYNFEEETDFYSFPLEMFNYKPCHICAFYPT